MSNMWLEIIGVAMTAVTGASTTGWLWTRRRLQENRREREDLANSTLVIEEERRMLDLMARGASLGDVLDTLTRAIERISPGALCTVLLLDEVHRRNLLKCSGPSMPEEYLAAVNGLEIGPDVGACGSAAYRNQTIIVEDIATDFRFEQGREFILSYGLRSCWSVPIRDSRGDVLGTFAMYHRVPATPRPEELRMTQAAAQLAGNAIERIRAEQTLRETTQRLNMAERVAQFGIWEADISNGVINISKGMAAMMERSGGPLRMSVEEFDALIHPDDVGALRAGMQQVRAGGETVQDEFRFVLPSGSVRWIRSHWCFEETAGAPTRATGAVIDITDERRVLIHLEKAREKAEASADAAREAGRLEEDRKSILEMVAKDQPLDQIAMMMSGAVARHLHGSVCSIQLELPDASRIAVSPRMPEPFCRALAALPIAAMQETLSPRLTKDLSTDPEWQRCVETCGMPSLQKYRAAPILRGNRPAGLIISFFQEIGNDSPSNPSQSNGAETDKVLESWGQFATLAVERRGLYEQLSFRAQYDSLTTLLNRASLYERMDVEIARSAREGGSMAVVYLDLDHFKEINDRYGHGAGDMVLQNVSRQILNSIRRSDVAARIGGDEFVVLLPGVGERAEAGRVADLITNLIGQTSVFNGNKLNAGASVGISIFPEDGTNADTPLNRADEYMYRNKVERKGSQRRQPRLPESVTERKEASLTR
jgi:diguanylate cyclase (GGDEF)-like protein